jgi:hypothetical protein
VGIDLNDLQPVFSAFRPGRDIRKIRTLTSGHIHGSWKLLDSGGDAYVLQRINQQVFSRLDALAFNTNALHRALPREASGLRYPRLYTDPLQELLHRSQDGSIWRLQEFLLDTYTIDRCANEHMAFDAGRAAGQFLRTLNRAIPEPLWETIPGFHDIDQRWQQLTDTVAKQPDRLLETSDIWSQLQEHWEELRPLLPKGLPVRNVHNDPKLGNMLFEEGTDHLIAVIDWDTIMPGTLLTDYGDLVRSVCATAPEDEADTGQVAINEEYLREVRSGFISGLGTLLSQKEADELDKGPIWIILEQAIRFFNDYLAGDVYYPVAYGTQNLDRARNQLALLGSYVDKI